MNKIRYCPNLRFFPQQNQRLTVQNRTAPKIIEGVVIGVVAGIMVALILETGGWVRRNHYRKEQIRHIKTFIEKTEDRIQKGEDEVPKVLLDVPEGGKEKLNVHLLRFTYYQELIRDLKMILEDRSGELSYEQRYELRAFIGDHEKLISSVFAKKAPPMWFYEQFVFEALCKLEWIQIRKPC